MFIFGLILTEPQLLTRCCNVSDDPIQTENRAMYLQNGDTWSFTNSIFTYPHQPALHHDPPGVHLQYFDLITLHRVDKYVPICQVFVHHPTPVAPSSSFCIFWVGQHCKSEQANKQTKKKHVNRSKRSGLDQICILLKLTSPNSRAVSMPALAPLSVSIHRQI